MIVDASIWVAHYLADDVHHQVSTDWFASLNDRDRLSVPATALAEVAGAVARRTGDPAAARRAVQHMLTVPRLQVVPVQHALAHRASEIAADQYIRGADAVYVALAATFDLPLVTFDQELGARAGALVRVIRPE